MLTGMRHIELHVVQTPTDAEAAVAAGLLEDDFYLTDCSACGDEIGAADEFVPYVLCLDEDFQWAICLYCAEPITDPVLMVEPEEDDAFDNFVEIDD
jgi:hypothetical protein